MIRGGATKEAEVQEFLKANGFTYEDRPTYAWVTYANREECEEILAALEEDYLCTVYAKKTMDENYILDGFGRRQP